jgi:hypothetical protein
MVKITLRLLSRQSLEEELGIRAGTFCTSKLSLVLPLYTAHKVVYHTTVVVLLFQVSHVCTLLEDNPL